MDESDVCQPDTLYGASKLMGEGVLRAETRNTGLSWNVARLFFIYGPNQFANGGYKSVIISNFERLLNDEAPIIRGDGSQSLDYVYIDDCVEALRTMSNSEIDRQVTNISSATPVSINQLTREMAAIAKSENQPIFEPADWTAGTSRWGINKNALNRFGWEFKTPLEVGLGSVYEWMKKQKSNG
jgi:UDP-glucose 4-epimerase